MISINSYFYQMWISRVATIENWIIAIFFLQFVLLSQLYRGYKYEAAYFIRLFDFTSYLRIFGKERDMSLWRPFQLGIYIFLMITLSLLITFVWSHYFLIAHSPNVFLTSLGVLVALSLLRYLSLRLIAWLFELQPVSNLLIFKGISSYGYLALILYCVNLLYFFSPLEKRILLLWISLGLFLIGNLFIQSIHYLGLTKPNFRSLVYIFLYICTFKIAPWIWIYKWIGNPFELN